MTDRNSDFDVLRDLLGQGDAVGGLLSARGAFEAAYKAFRDEDAAGFQAVIERAGLHIHCERICAWIRMKECVFLCLELAGPPRPFERAPDPRMLAQAIGRLASDERLVKQVAETLVKRDRKGFAAVLKRLEIEPYAHFFCHWLCTIRYRLVCHWICTIGRGKPPILWAELQTAARAIGVVAADERGFKALATASAAGDAVKLGDVLRNPAFFSLCHWVCEYFCSWRCVLACLTLSRGFPFAEIEAAAQVREARAFGEAAVKLRDNPNALMRLSAAVGAGQVDGWSALVKELKFERYALQLCHWICGWRCLRFCRLVCIDIHFHPLFYRIGDFKIDSQFDANGLTNSLGQGINGNHGGPGFGLYSNLALFGLCPAKDPGHPTEPMAYRFLFQPDGGAPTPITAGFVAQVQVAVRYIPWNGSLKPQNIIVRGAGKSPEPTPPSPAADPPDHYIVPDGNGWVLVDPEAWGGAFTGDLMGFATTAAFPGGPAPTSVAAGAAVPAAEQKNGSDCAIIFEATRVSTRDAVNAGGAADYSNGIGKVHINNWEAVHLIDLLQFHTGGGTACSPLGNALDIEYTVDHELMLSWNVDVYSASGKSLTAPPHSPPLPPPPPRSAAGTYHEDISSWPTCSYTAYLNTQCRLTDGRVDQPGVTQLKTFCIGLRRP